MSHPLPSKDTPEPGAARRSPSASGKPVVCIGVITDMASHRTFREATRQQWAHLMLSYRDVELSKQFARSIRLIEESRRLLASRALDPSTVWTGQTSPEDTSGQNPPHGAVSGASYS